MVYNEELKSELFQKICKEIENNKSVREILRTEGMPSRSKFYEWLDESEEKQNQYARACEARSDAIFDEILEIADDGSNDYMKKLKGDEMVDVLDSEHVQRSKLRIDARKWKLSKMNPKKYGDKLDVNASVTIQPFLTLMQSATPKDDNE